MAETTERIDAGLQFGLKGVAPPDAEAVWGARWIFPDDLVWDRQSWAGGELAQEYLQDWLNTVPMDENGVARGTGLTRLSMARERAKTMAESGVMASRDDQERTLYADMEGRIVCNPRRSYGYLYVVAWRHPQKERTA